MAGAGRRQARGDSPSSLFPPLPPPGETPPMENKKCKSGGARVSGKRSCARPGLAVPLLWPPAWDERPRVKAFPHRPGQSGAPPACPRWEGARAEPALGMGRAPQPELFPPAVPSSSQLPKVAEALRSFSPLREQTRKGSGVCLLGGEPAELDCSVWRRLRGALINACKYLQGGCRERGARLFSGAQQRDKKQWP